MFPRVSRSNPSEQLHRWQPLKGRQRPYMVRYLVKCVEAIKRPMHLQTKKKKKKCSQVLLFARTFSTHFPFLPNTFLHIKTFTKQIKADSSLHQKYKVLSLYPIFFSLVLHLGFGVQRWGCSFLATIHTPNFLNLFLAFNLLFLP